VPRPSDAKTAESQDENKLDENKLDDPQLQRAVDYLTAKK
jgi:hypothetical protein